MSIKTSLLATTLFVCLLVGVTVGSLSITNLNRNVKQEAQRRVNHDLMIASAEYQRQLEEMAKGMANLHDWAYAVASGGGIDNAELFPVVKERLGLTILNLCRPTGSPIAGSYADFDVPVPIDRDPVIRRALLGNKAFGSLLLGPGRLRL